MIQEGILNPALAELLCRFRHTNRLVIADKGFPYWPQVPILDLSVVEGLPTVRQILSALKGRYRIGAAWMAVEFHEHNQSSVAVEYIGLLDPVKIQFEAHFDFKHRVPESIGLIRTGDATPYGNIILESA